jgi:phenol 2-monooxygenase
VLPTKLEVDESAICDTAAYPISVTVEHMNQTEATPDSLTNVGGIKSGLFRSSLISAEMEEKL